MVVVCRYGLFVAGWLIVIVLVAAGAGFERQGVDGGFRDRLNLPLRSTPLIPSTISPSALGSPLPPLPLPPRLPILLCCPLVAPPDF